MANFQLQDTQKVPYSIVVVDADGNPAGGLSDGSVLTVDSSDTTMATIVGDASPTPPSPGVVATGFIVGGTVLGTVQITAAETKADGTAGLNGNVMIDIVASAAALLSINLGTPVSQTETTPTPPAWTSGPSTAPPGENVINPEKK